MMRKRFLPRLCRRSELGQSLAEFALIAPIFFLMVFGIVDLSRAFPVVHHHPGGGAQRARYAVTGRIDCTGVAIQNRDACIKQTVAVRVQSLSDAASITTTYRSWQYPAYADPATENNPGTSATPSRWRSTTATSR